MANVLDTLHRCCLSIRVVMLSAQFSGSLFCLFLFSKLMLPLLPHPA